MELKIKPITFPEALEFNFEEIKAEIEGMVAHYKGLVYTDEQIKDGKKDVANLRKFSKALSDERIKVKKQCLQPYEAFEAKVKELDAIVQEPIALIDKQIKEYEEEQKRRKLEEITEYKKGVEANLPSGFVLPVDEKWLNASVTMAKVKEAIDEQAALIEKNIVVLDNLPEYGFEAVEKYKATLDVTEALAEAQRLSEMARRKAEAEAKRAAEQAAREAEAQAAQSEQIPGQTSLADAEYAEVQPEATDDFIPDFSPEEPAGFMPEFPSWVTYRVLVTPDQGKEVEKFLADKQITFKEVK
jgi:hypothetical protein